MAISTDTKAAIANNKPVEAIIASCNLKNLLPRMVKSYDGLAPCLDSNIVFKLDANKFGQEIEKLGFLAIAGLFYLRLIVFRGAAATRETIRCSFRRACV